MKILDNKSLEKLKDATEKNHNLVFKPFSELISELGLQQSIERYDFNFQKLIEPQMLNSTDDDGNKIARDVKDVENSILLGKALPNLQPSDATDESLWVTLCFEHYQEYVCKRWPTTSQTKTRDHFFGVAWRERTRQNAISRLWLMNHFAEKVDKKNTKKVLEILTNNSDYFASLTERASSANIIKILRSIVEITDDNQKKGILFNREKFRNFMKEVDFLGKRTLLGALPESIVKSTLEPIYLRCYK